MSNSSKLAIFDMDGTIIDSAEFIKKAMAEAFLGLDRAVPSDDAIMSIIGLSLPEAVRRLMPSLSVSEIDHTVAGYKASFIAMRKKQGGEQGSLPYEGALACLNNLATQDKFFLGLATGKARRGVDHAFNAFDLNGVFHSVQTADNHPSKPHPSMVLQCLSDTGVAAQDSVMIGDTTFDIEMGCAAGVHTIGVTWGYHSAQALKDCGADILVDTYAELPAAMNKLWNMT